MNAVLRRSSGLATVAAVLASSAAFAHHSPSAFDISGQVTVEGTLTKVDWTNPHVYLTVETVGANGQRALQQVESVSVASAQSMGLKRDVLTIGSRVVVRAHPNRRGVGYTVLGADVTTSDGTTYALGGTGRNSRPPAATVPATGLAGHWAPKLNPRLVPTVQSWPLSDKGRAALAAVMSGSRALSAGCTALPPPMLTQLPPLRTLEVLDDRVVMKVDADGVDATRTVHLDLAEHPANVAPSLLGHSIGKWEGATLVIDTVAFTPNQVGVGFGIPSSAGKHLIERLTLAADGLQLHYELTLEDPEYLAAPASYTAMWDHRPDLALSGAACDPEIAERYRED
jgi:hypothetical protein